MIPSGRPVVRSSGRLAEKRVIFVDNAADALLNQRWPLLCAARAAGWQVACAVPDGPRVAELESHGLRVHRWPASRRGLGPVGELVALAWLVRLFRRERPDLVHVRTPKAVLYGGIAARLAGVPAVVSHVTGLGFAAGGGGGWRAAWAGFGLRVLAGPAFHHPRQRVIVQNPDDAAAVAALGCDPARIRLIRGSGVDPQRFAPAPPADGPPLIVLPARMLLSKGVAVFVAAARLLRAQGVAARCVLVGPSDPGNPEGVDEADLRAWQAEGAVAWWGERRDMPAVYAQAAIVCLPSWYREGLPKAILEAMACALPVVTCDSVGCREAVADGVNGLLVPPRDPAALAAALARLIADPALRGRLGAAGRQRVLDEFAEGPVIARTMAVLVEALDDRTTGRPDDRTI
jgi:glycosyltransferase involved in cell wall biosynthesis